jgi:hypothetical protein
LRNANKNVKTTPNAQVLNGMRVDGTDPSATSSLPVTETTELPVDKPREEDGKTPSAMLPMTANLA